MSAFEEEGRRVRIRTRLPTGIPGVSLRVRGHCRYKIDERITRAERPVLRLVAAHSVHLIARDLARFSVPGEDHDLGERVSLTLSNWQRSPLEEYPGLRVRARVLLKLSRTDRRRVAEYHAVRRARHGELAFRSDRLDHFSRRVLHDTASARFWWVEHHGTSQEARKTFDELFLPLVSNGGVPPDRTTKIAAIIAEAIRRLEGEPGDYEQLVHTVKSLLRLAGQVDLADQLGEGGNGHLAEKTSTSTAT